MPRPPHAIVLPLMTVAALILPTAAAGAHPAYRAVQATAATTTAAITTTTAATATDSTTCDGTWRHVRGSRLLYESGGDVLALDSAHVYVSGPRGSLARWTAHGWVYGEVPGLDSPGQLAGSSANDVWALGPTTDPATPRGLRHFDGSSWTAVALPARMQSDDIFVVDMVRTAREVWVLAYRWDDGRQPVLWRYDGSDWERVPGDVTRSADSEPNALAVRPGGQVWFVGWDALIDVPGFPATGTPYAARVVDGQLRRVDVPADQGRAGTELRALAWAANGDLVVGGFSIDPDTEVARPYLVRRHDGVWTRMTHPEPIGEDMLVEVLARVDDRLYAGLSGSTQGRFARIDGTTFSVLPHPWHQDAVFADMAATPGGDGYAVTNGEGDMWLSRLC